MATKAPLPPGALLRSWCRAKSSAEAPRVLAFVAHPDDDIIGFGGRVSQVAGNMHLAYVSDGAPVAERFYRPLGFETRQAYAETRRREARRALALAGVPLAQVHELGLIDQAVVHSLVLLVASALELIQRVAPAAVLTHAYEGGHPDHDATACCVHVALRKLAIQERERPALWEFASYYAQGSELARGRFIPAGREEQVPLSEAARERKQALLSCHETQRCVWGAFPLDAEHFRVAPAYDFAAPPAAPFHYDRVDWGVSGDEWLSKAREALAHFGVQAPC